LESITHASFSDYSVAAKCYQRLEFLGDAVLDLLISRYYYNSNDSGLSPGQLTDLKIATVNNETFARLTTEHCFHAYLRHHSSTLFSKINMFVNAFQEEKSLGGYRGEELYPPKVLSDLFESIAGGILIDSGDIEVVWSVYKNLLFKCEWFVTYLDPNNPPVHPVREFGETAQKNGCSIFVWKDKKGNSGESASCTLLLHGVTIAYAEAESAKVARRLAAKIGIKEIQKNPNFWKEKCSCRST